MKSRFLYILLSVFFLIFYSGYNFLNGGFTNYVKNEKNGEYLYKSINNNIEKMNGKIINVTGKLSFGFVIRVEFPNLYYNENDLFKEFNLLGFSLKSIEKNTFTFCKNKEGILVTKKDILIVRYQYKMEDCMGSLE